MENKLIKNKHKIVVKDFINHFRNRYKILSKIIQEENNLLNLISINKLSKEKENVSIIGIIKEKKITKKGHLMITIEDLTGIINLIIPVFKVELFKKGLDICLDSVIGFMGVGNNEILFIEDIIFPEARLKERKKNNKDESAIFIGDLHFGNKNFLKEEFQKFIDYLSIENEENKNIKYLFIVGDLIDGVGNYKNQEYDLEIKDIKKQFYELSILFKKIRKDIQIIISSGDSDGVRLMEPQLEINKEYAKDIYKLENVKFIQNPNNIKIGNLNFLIYHGFSFFYYADNIESLIKENAINNPEKIMKYLLKNRHLSPTNIASEYFPGEEDKLLIKEVPDIFISGHTHKSAITYSNNILLISVSCWDKTNENKKNKNDFAKVPLLNLKTRAVKILDFNENMENLK